MYAIVETGGKQYRVQPGDTIAVERLTGEPGETLDLGRVLLVGGDGETHVGAPEVADAVVRAEVVEHARGEKVIVFRYKSKVRYRRKTGHRQALTRLRITDILLGGVPSTVKAESATEPAAAAPRTRKRAAPATAAEAQPAEEATTELPAAEAGPPPAAEETTETT